MEILLLQDINGIGKKNDLLVVGDGFALNFLLPRRAALVATPVVRRRYAEAIRKRAEERERERLVRVGAAQALAGKIVTFTRKATKTGKLYAAISEEAIAAALQEQHSISVKPEHIQIPAPIKAVGTSQVTMEPSAGQQVSVSIVVEAQKA